MLQTYNTFTMLSNLLQCLVSRESHWPQYGSLEVAVQILRIWNALISLNVLFQGELQKKQFSIVSNVFETLNSLYQQNSPQVDVSCSFDKHKVPISAVCIILILRRLRWIQVDLLKTIIDCISNTKVKGSSYRRFHLLGKQSLINIGCRRQSSAMTTVFSDSVI